MEQEIFIAREIKTSKSAEEIFETFKNRPYCVLLDSPSSSNGLGECSIIAFEPFLVFKSKGNAVNIWTRGHSYELAGDPLAHLQSIFRQYNIYGVNCGIPFAGGGIGYFSYDLCGMLERIEDRREDDLCMPDIIFCFYNTAIVVNHAENKTYAAVSPAGQDKPYCPEEKLDAICTALAERGREADGAPAESGLLLRFRSPLISNFTREQYCDMVRTAKEYIRNGDIYQVNLSQRFKTTLGTAHLFNLYKKLRRLNPAPFSAYLDFGDIKVLSTSPERFIKIRDGIIETRPIKGTRPRGKSLEEDVALCRELLASEKDRAELTMIIDLERNDLGKVCEIGSVHVKRLFEVEHYATVHHLVSTIEGKLKPGVDAIDCIRAAFPGGSITGAPKIRAMEIINELEPAKRDIYTGSIGYIGFDGNCDLNIAIRTVIAKGNDVFYNVGGGIVWDSEPEKEYQETLDKGEALMQALSEGG